ncbi:MAG: hypothetical protein QXM75_00175 [Candidatus Diapherotrites archaeon]
MPKTLSRSSYTYQKLFRALYGYTQVVNKSNGKRYRYHRKGILSDVPFIRPSKNSLIIPTDALQKLINFFNTGENPAHRWTAKGDWKAVYYLSDKQISEQSVARAFEQVLDRQWVNYGGEKMLLEDFLSKFVPKKEELKNKKIVQFCNYLTSHEWFAKSYVYSDRLKKFKTLCENLS